MQHIIYKYITAILNSAIHVKMLITVTVARDAPRRYLPDVRQCVVKEFPFRSMYGENCSISHNYNSS